MNKGFTLAEILITLGIVGVVAAITLPTIIMNYKRIVWVNQLKANYTILTNGFSQMANSEGATSLAESDTFRSLSGAGCGTDPQYSEARCSKFFNNFKKFFKGDLQIAENYQYSTEILNPSNKKNYSEKNIFIMPNGSIIFNYYFFPIGYSTAIYNQGGFYIDTNGYKGPNVFGRDIFYFGVILDPPYIVPGGSKLCKETKCIDFPYWKECRGCCKADNFAPMGFMHNTSCAGRIIDEGWKMNY